MYKNGFGIKLLTMVDMPQNPTQPNQTNLSIYGGGGTDLRDSESSVMILD